MLDLSVPENDGISDEGINALARAVEAHMLPMLECMSQQIRSCDF